MIAVIIQARMGSTRLPGKILKELAGKPMLWHVVNRAKHAKKVDKVIVATTIEKEDDIVEELAKKEGWDYFRGSADNVLERYYKAAKQAGADVIVRITSDCPLIDPEIIDGCVEAFRNQKCDYISNTSLGDVRGLPRGIDDIEIFSIHALEKARNEAKEMYGKEHVTPYIWENKRNIFTIGKGPRLKDIYARNYRLTVDYPEDFEVIKAVYNSFSSHSQIFLTEHIISFLDSRPDIVVMNAHCVQKPVT
ncbi:MAG: glycosyltransferase family protein [bacterium]|nr:glycosyltransferase family protein [bacterium]